MAGVKSCQYAREHVVAHDTIDAHLIELLKLPIAERDTDAQAARKNLLLVLFAGMPAELAQPLLVRLTNRKDLLRRLFECELTKGLRTRLLAKLKDKPGADSDAKAEAASKTPSGIRIVEVGPSLEDNPLRKERYIDNIATGLGRILSLPQWDLLWIEDGVERVVNITDAEVSSHRGKLVLDYKRVFDSEKLARFHVFRVQQQYARSGAVLIVAFYRGPHDTVLPTLYTVDTAPRFFLGMRRYLLEGLSEDARIFAAYFHALREFANPLPVSIDAENELDIKAPKLSKLLGLRKIIARGSNAITDFFRTLKKKNVHWASADGKHTVYLTGADQLVGTHRALKEFQASPEGVGYRGWDSHHIVEERHLKLIGVRDIFPKRDDLPCVLFPKKGHSKRIAGRLTRELPPSEGPYSDFDVFEAYVKAYSELDDYTGKGAKAIQNELVSVVKDMLGLGGADKTPEP